MNRAFIWRLSTESALSALHEAPEGHFNHWTFLNPLGSITDELSLQITRHPSILPQSDTRFTHEWGEEMRVKSLSQGLNVDLAQPELEAGTF